VSYDANGRIATQTYPTGLVVKYVYTSLGYLKEVRNNQTNALLWRGDTQNAMGQLLQQTYGNNVVTQQVSFVYGPDHQRIKQVAPSATTIYLNPDNTGGLFYEKDIKADGTVEHKHYITAGGSVIALAAH